MWNTRSKKERRQIWLIGIFLLAGCVFGYFVAVTQENQLQDPAYIAFWTSQNMPVPEPGGFAKNIVAMGLLFSGIPTGLIFFRHIAEKWLTSAAPKICIGFLTFPIYTCIGIVCSIPFMIYLALILARGKRR